MLLLLTFDQRSSSMKHFVTNSLTHPVTHSLTYEGNTPDFYVCPSLCLLIFKKFATMNRLSLFISFSLIRMYNLKWEGRNSLLLFIKSFYHGNFTFSQSKFCCLTEYQVIILKIQSVHNGPLFCLFVWCISRIFVAQAVQNIRRFATKKLRIFWN